MADMSKALGLDKLTSGGRKKKRRGGNVLSDLLSVKAGGSGIEGSASPFPVNAGKVSGGGRRSGKRPRKSARRGGRSHKRRRAGSRKK